MLASVLCILLMNGLKWPLILNKRTNCLVGVVFLLCIGTYKNRPAFRVQIDKRASQICMIWLANLNANRTGFSSYFHFDNIIWRARYSIFVCFPDRAQVKRISTSAILPGLDFNKNTGNIHMVKTAFKIALVTLMSLSCSYTKYPRSGIWTTIQ